MPNHCSLGTHSLSKIQLTESLGLSSPSRPLLDHPRQLRPGPYLLRRWATHHRPNPPLAPLPQSHSHHQPVLDHVDLAECRRRGVAVVDAGKAFAEDAADSAVGLFIDVMRKISASNRYVRDGLWATRGDYPLGSKIGGKKVGIVGLGNIGLEVAKRLEAFGCTVLYNSRSEKPSLSYQFYSNVCELAADSDALIICCALTAETHHMINKEVLSALGREGVIVNVGRRIIIDEKEMVQCLLRGEIRGAGLDVFENEPDVPKELFALDNVVLSLHQAVATHEAIVALGELVTGNLESFFSNKPLLSPAVIN